MAFTSLSAPPMEDSMEVSSSPANGPFDADIDLDPEFGDYDDVPFLEDDHMHEDGDPMRPGTATDEEMGDDDNTITAPLTEEVMQDDHAEFDIHGQEAQDEDLIDYDDTADYQGQEASDEFGLAQNGQVSSTAFVEVEADEAGSLRQLNDSAVGDEDVTLKKTVANADESVTGPDATGLDHPADSADNISARPTANTRHVQNGEDGLEQPELQSERQGSPEGSTNEAVEGRALYDDGDVAAEQPLLHVPDALRTSIDRDADGPPTPTDTGLHPMTVQFGGHEMPLFKSHKQPDGLLKDDNLVSVSLADLLYTCRRRLQLKLGVDCITDGQELLLKFDQLGGLVLLEGSRGASAASLNDVFEVFKQLHQNENLDIPSFSLYLSASGKFIDNLGVLKRAAADGKGASALFQPATKLSQTFDPGTVSDQDNEPFERQVQDFTALGGQGYAGSDDEDPAHIEEPLLDDGDGPEPEGIDRYGEDTQDHSQYEEYENESSHGHPSHADSRHPEKSDRLRDGNDQSRDVDRDDKDPIVGINPKAEQPGRDHESRTIQGSNMEKNSIKAERHVSQVIDDNDTEQHRTDQNAYEGQEQQSKNLTESHLEGTDSIPAYEHKSTDVALAASSIEEKAESPAQESYSYEDPHLDLDDPANQAHVLSAEDKEHADENTSETQYEDLTGEDLALLEEHEADNADINNAGEAQPEENPEQFESTLDVFGDDNYEPGYGADGQVDETPLGSNQVDEDDIGYDDDFGDVQPAMSTGISNSELGKRSFDEHTEEDLFDLEESDSKRVRSQQ